MIEIVTYALELFLDSVGDAAVRELWNRLEDAGLQSLATRSHRRHRPQVTLAVAEQFEVDDRARSLLEQTPGTELTMPVLGTFPGEAAVLFLGVTSNAALLNTHAALRAAIASGSAGLWDHYRPGNWVPHCTLAMDWKPDRRTHSSEAVAEPRTRRQCTIMPAGWANRRTNRAVAARPRHQGSSSGRLWKRASIRAMYSSEGSQSGTGLSKACCHHAGTAPGSLG